MKQLVVMMALAVLASAPAVGGSMATDSEYLVFHTFDAEDRIYDLADGTFNTSNGLNEPHLAGKHCGGGYYDPDSGFLITSTNGVGDGSIGYKTLLSAALAGDPEPSSDIDDWGLALGRYCGAPDGSVWNRHLSGARETARFDFDTNSIHNPPDWGAIGGPTNGGNRERYYYDGAVYEINHCGGIWKMTWNGIYGDMAVGPWDTPVEPGYSTSRWTGYNGALDGNGILYGGPGDGSTVFALDLDVVGADTLVATLPGVTLGGVTYQRSIQNDAGDIQVNTEGTTLYISGRLIGPGGSPLQSYGFFGTYDMVNDMYTPVVDGTHPPDLGGGIQDSWRLTYIDLRATGGPGDPSPLPEFVRGDADDNGLVNLTDVIFTLNHLFLGGASPICFDAADTDNDGIVQLTDGVYLLNYLFLAGEPPPAPHDGCGPDLAEAADDLGCESFDGCP